MNDKLKPTPQEQGENERRYPNIAVGFPLERSKWGDWRIQMEDSTLPEVIAEVKEKLNDTTGYELLAGMFEYGAKHGFKTWEAYVADPNDIPRLGAFIALVELGASQSAEGWPEKAMALIGFAEGGFSKWEVTAVELNQSKGDGSTFHSLAGEGF